MRRAPSTLRPLLAAAFVLATLDAHAAVECPDPLGQCIVDGAVLQLGGEHRFTRVEVRNSGRIEVPRFDGQDRVNTGNLQLVAEEIVVDATSVISADGRGYQPVLCDDGAGPNGNAGGRGGCSVRDSGGGGAHFGGGGRGTKDCFIFGPRDTCEFPEEWEEDCGRRTGNRCRNTRRCYDNDALPSVAGVAYRHSIYEIELGAAGGDKGCRDGWDGVSTGGGGGGRIVLVGLRDDGAGLVRIDGRVSADGWRGCGHGNDSAGGGAGGAVVVAGDRVVVGAGGRVSAAGGLGGDTRNSEVEGQPCPAGSQSGGTCDDCGGGGGGGVVAVLSGATSEISASADLDVSGSLGGTCGICNGEAGGGAGELQLSGVYAGEVCDGWDNDFDGATDEDLGGVICGVGDCAVMQPACDVATGLPTECVPATGPGCGDPLGDARPRLLVIVDTSASMLTDVRGLPTFGDGSVEHPGVGEPSRLFLAKEALTGVLSAYPEMDYALARFAQHVGASRECARAAHTECGGACCTYDSAAVDGGTEACVIATSAGPQTAIGVSDDAACVHYSGWCGQPQRGADMLVGFDRPLAQHLMWLDHAEGTFVDTTTPGDHCSFTEGGDCELRATGPTPLAGALHRARTYLAERRILDPAASCRSYSVILLTDGAETCFSDPVAAASELLSAVGVETFVVGFSVLDEERSMLEDVARAGSANGTRGAFFADTAAELSGALASIVGGSVVFERCNGADDDCDCPGDTNGDGAVCGPGDVGVDEGFAGLGVRCDDGRIGRCLGIGAMQCNAAGDGVECVIDAPGEPAGDETCNDGTDEDCDGRIDEGCAVPTELCNGVDDDGDPETADGSGDPEVGRPCGVAAGACTPGVVVCEEGRRICSGATSPSVEACNGIDDDCNGVTDGLAEACYDGVGGCPEGDGPCLGSCRRGVRVCAATFGDGTVPAGVWGACLGAVLPVVPDVCDGFDSDCDGLTDEDDPTVACYPPGSGSGTGCELRAGRWRCVGRCRDGVRECAVSAGASCEGFVPPRPEACDGVDDDCDDLTDEGLSRPCAIGCVPGTEICRAGSWVDCNAAEVGEERCNGLDDDCDGAVDEATDGTDLLRPCSTDCGPGQERCILGTWLGCDAPRPATEGCNAVDDDCDGMTDEELDRSCLNVCGPGLQDCRSGVWQACSVVASEEICDAFDNDCDGVVDLLVETCSSVCGEGQRTCTAGDWQPCTAAEPEPERCNLADDDCDGAIDEAPDEICDDWEKLCFEGRCLAACDSGTECSGLDEVCVEGLCIPGPCNRITCEAEQVCVDGECIDAGCVERTCPPSTLCSRGICVDRDCYLEGCPGELTCLGGVCQPDPCADSGCRTDEACSAGDCFPSCAGVECLDGQRCFRGLCLTDPCLGIECPTGEGCFHGRCLPDPCSGLECPRGRICDAGRCLPDPCLQVRCPEGETCVEGGCFGPGDPEVDGGAGSEDGPRIAPPTPGSGDGGGAADALGTVGRDLREVVIGSGDGTCGCRVGPARRSGPPAGALLVVLLVLGWWLRRRGVGSAPLLVLLLLLVPISGCPGSEVAVRLVLDRRPPPMDAAGVGGAAQEISEAVEDVPIQDPDAGGCVWTNGGIEICDERDNDCDEFTDEGYVFTDDPLHCGGCGRACDFPNMVGHCVEGRCKPGECLPGWIDLDGDPRNGCDGTCSPTNGGIEICDGEDNDCDAETDERTDLETDPENCGSCGHVCVLPNAVPRCEVARCAVERCEAGWSNLDGSGLNGCEADCVPTAGGVELCDGEDNDCDGVVDDGFYVDLDPANCGECGRACALQNAEPLCVDGLCVIGGCDEGWTDADGDPATGCEEICVDSGESDEVCNGTDDDCDGRADEGFRDATGTYNVRGDHCGACDRPCAIPHAWATCTDDGACVFDACAPGWHDANADLASDGCELACVATSPDVDRCNGLDDDCDGATDEDGASDDGVGCYPFASGCDDAGGAGWLCEGICAAGVTGCEGDGQRCVGATGPRNEACDGIDDDCDGHTDEDFDLDNDIRTCGSCDHRCDEHPPANAVLVGCFEAMCQWTCAAGWVDLDADLTDGESGGGCEYECTATAPESVEACDGFDNDCDGLTDEPEDLVAPPDGLCEGSPGTPCADAVSGCAEGSDGVRFRCLYPDGVEVSDDASDRVAATEQRCDGVDGDCDGRVDEGFEPEVGTPCDNGGVGDCRDVGAHVCTADGAATECVLDRPGPGASDEVCDGRDNDCDGLTDEPEHLDAQGTFVVDTMVRVAVDDLDFRIYAYEASRPDASADDPGQADHRACSQAGVLPWERATFDEAERACVAAGLRLCTAAEWEAACSGASHSAYPYGPEYEPTTCNGVDAGLGAITPTGGRDGCLTPSADEGIHDLSGNVKEWVAGEADEELQPVRGGSYLSPRAGLRCDFALTVLQRGARVDGVGLRCCGD